jgi:serine protease inhibitor
MFSPATVLALFNTVHLKVQWEHFDEADTYDEPFTLTGGEQVQVPMMHAGDLEARVAQTDEYDAVALETDGPVTVWIVVPKGETTAEALLGGFDAQRLEQLYAETSTATGSLALPRFTTEYEAKGLTDTLADMGMPRAFSPSEAEFPGIADVAPERLFISEVVQKTFVDLNEQGVEAAAASGAIMEVTSAPAARLRHPRRPSVPLRAHGGGDAGAALHGARARPALSVRGESVGRGGPL